MPNLRLQSAAMGIGDRARQGQPESHIPTTAGLIGPPETFENQLPLFNRDSRTVILNAQLDP